MRWLTLSLVAVVLGCSSTTAPDRVRVLGTIAGLGEDVRVDVVPDERTVTVRVTTFGNGCYTKGETEAAVERLEATITPWDYTPHPDAGVACTSILRAFTHEAVVRFDTAGTARVVVRGIDRSHASAHDPHGDVITVERMVEIP